MLAKVFMSQGMIYKAEKLHEVGACFLTGVASAAALWALARPDNAARCGVWRAGDTDSRTDKCRSPYLLRSIAGQACQGVRTGGTGVPLLRSRFHARAASSPAAVVLLSTWTLPGSHLFPPGLPPMPDPPTCRASKAKGSESDNLAPPRARFFVCRILELLARAPCLNAASLSSVQVACRSHSY